MTDENLKLARNFDVILAPIITEKATIGAERNEVTFRVPLDATKADVKEAVERLFKVKVVAVNTIVSKGKNKRFRGLPYKKSDTKKAIVKLREGDTIDVTTGL